MMRGSIRKRKCDIAPDCAIAPHPGERANGVPNGIDRVPVYRPFSAVTVYRRP